MSNLSLVLPVFFMFPLKSTLENKVAFLPITTQPIPCRCQILKKSKRFSRRIKPRNAGRPETLGLQPNFHNLLYCATYKGGYTFWKHVYHQKLSNSKQNLVAQPVFNKSVHSPHTVSQQYHIYACNVTIPYLNNDLDHLSYLLDEHWGYWYNTWI